MLTTSPEIMHSAMSILKKLDKYTNYKDFFSKSAFLANIRLTVKCNRVTALII